MHASPMPLVSIPLTSKWCKGAVTSLIELYRKEEAKFNKPSTKKKMVWQIIARQVNERGFNFSASQCEQKWKNLTKAYRDCIDHNKRSGNDRKECPYFKDLEECYGYKPNVRPVFTLGTASTSTGNDKPASTADM
ncbi:hypothetical protein CI610_02925 [invertebrate metagenome]|uniref:Myb/SANT-like DNA-binding domain-containing protein n=1 Tax=invertebrate metagenome TaxID=1711999 RepID=A0A2H9T4H6_9ZZZZ